MDEFDGHAARRFRADESTVLYSVARRITHHSSELRRALSEIGDLHPSLASDESDAVQRQARQRGVTDREMQVMGRALETTKPADIARELHISPHTVRNHLKSIYRKLGIHSQRELFQMTWLRAPQERKPPPSG